jgi:hypothetical protein
MDVMSVNLDSSAEWWWRDFPLSANTVWLVATLGSALFLLSIWKLRQDLGISVKINKKDFMQSA